MHLETPNLAPSSELAREAHKREGAANPFISLANLQEQCLGDDILQECLAEMVSYSCSYTETLCRFAQIVAKGQSSNEGEARAEIERVRSRTHDATIDAINILSRALKSAGRDNSWISKMAGNRASYGKFAMLIAFEDVLTNQRG